MGNINQKELDYQLYLLNSKSVFFEIIYLNGFLDQLFILLLALPK